MTKHYPKIRLQVGDTVMFDGKSYEILRRADSPDGDDTFIVGAGVDRQRRHMDWFSQMARESDSVVIDR